MVLIMRGHHCTWWLLILTTAQANHQLGRAEKIPCSLLCSDPFQGLASPLWEILLCSHQTRTPGRTPEPASDHLSALLVPSAERIGDPATIPEARKCTTHSSLPEIKGSGTSRREITYSTSLPVCTLLISTTMTCMSPGFSSSAPVELSQLGSYNKLSCGS